MRLYGVCCAVLALWAIVPVAAAQTIDPAQAIAQKFSEASGPKTAATPERPSLDYEMDMLQRARAEELDRQQQDAKAVAAPPVKVAEPSLDEPAIAQPPSSAQPPPPAPPALPDASKVAPAPERPIAVQTLAAPDTPLPADAKPDGLGLTDVPDAMFGAMPRATVLLVLSPDDSTATTKPDPIICLEDRCWLSNGYEAPARPLLRSQAVALKTSTGASTDPCAGKSACVYRNIALRPDTQIEVVELGDGHGTRDRSYTVDVDASCRKHDNALTCANGLITREFRLWIVPEQVAQTTGPNLLEDAIVAGLPFGEIDASKDK